MGSRIHYECHMNEPEVVAVCAACRRDNCEGICNDYRNAVRMHLGLKPLPKKHGDYPTKLGKPRKKREKCQYINERKIEYAGERHTLGELAEIGGMGYNTLYMRLYRGMTIDDAMTRPIVPKGRKYITANGMTLTVKEWAERLGMKPGSIHERIRRGYSPEQAVTLERMA